MLAGVLLEFPGGSSGEEAAAGPAAATPTPADARDLLIAGDYDAAAGAYETLRKDPRYAVEAGLGLAKYRLQTGLYTEGIEGLRRLGAKDSQAFACADRHFLLGKLLRQTGRYPEVLDHARKAIDLDKNHAGARLLLGDMLETLGRRDEAIEAYRWFELQLLARAELPRDAQWLTFTARGFLRYSVLTRTRVTSRTKHVLHEMLQTAYGRLDRTWWPARIAAADLLREKFNNDPKDGCVGDYEAALRINPKLPEAHVGLGEVALQGFDFEEVERRADLALQTNPKHAPALHLLARKLLRERRYRQAADMCERALKINPNDIVALSLSGAAAACRYDEDEVEHMRSRVSAINPKCALFHRTLADALGAIRQYAAAEQEYLQAARLDPTDANARTELGMMCMQWGREEKARDALDAAWALDPFNERTKFTLDLLGSLQRFARYESDHFIIRHDPARDPGLGVLMGSYLEEIYEPVTGDYDTTLTEKTIVEVFPTQRSFAVRITGQPWLHTVGACTGRVIALASPRESPELMGPYDYARVLRHEFTHTVTLAATHNRIPHWLTEGLAVYQEDAPRSFAWCELLADAVRRKMLFTLESIDWGFIRPRRPNDRQLAYAQSEWMCENIVERFGYDTINAMLERFREGQTGKVVFKGQLGLEPTQFDGAFSKWAQDQAVAWGFDLTVPEDVVALRVLADAEPANAGVLGRLAKAQWDAGDGERALAAARRACELDENEPNALEVVVRILTRQMEGDLDEGTRLTYENEALSASERLLKVDADGWFAPKCLAQIALRRGDYDRAVAALRLLQRLCPMDPMSWRGLAGIYLDQGREDLALAQLTELARTNENKVDIPARIGGIYRRRGQLADARYWYRRALYINPFAVELHQALGDTNMQAGDVRGALREYTALTQLEPENPKHFENAAFAAHKLGDRAKAREFARQAAILDPTSHARTLLP